MCSVALAASAFQDEQLEEADEIVAVPLTGGVGLAEAELRAGGQSPEQTAVVDVHVDGGAGAEAPLGSVGKADLESSSLEVGELWPSTLKAMRSTNGALARGAGRSRDSTELMGAPSLSRARTEACGGTGPV